MKMKISFGVIFLLPFSTGVDNALERLTDRICKPLEELLEEKGQQLSLAISVEGDSDSIGRDSRLLEELEGLLRYRLEENRWVEQLVFVPAPLSSASLERARSAGADWLLHLRVGIMAERLVANVELAPLVADFWSRLAGRITFSLASHYTVVERVDASVNVLAAKKKLDKVSGGWSLTLLERFDKTYLAIAVGDMDGDGLQEVALLAQRSLDVFRLQEGRMKKLAEYDLEHLPRQPAISRDWAGRVLVVDVNRDGREEIFFGGNWLGHGELLAFSGTVFTSLRRFGAVPICLLQTQGRWQVILARFKPGTNVFDKRLQILDINSSSGADFSLPEDFVQPICPAEGGRWHWVEPSGTLATLVNGRTVLFEDCGRGALFLGGSDNGEDLWLFSSSSYFGQPDRIRVILSGREIWSSGELQGSVVDSTLLSDRGEGAKKALILTRDESLSTTYLYLFAGE